VPEPRVLVDQYGKPLAASYEARYVQPSLVDPAKYGDYRARLARYELYWAFYLSTQYDEQLNAWAKQFKHRAELYRHVRAIFSTGYRLGEFWATHLLGGTLDFDAGDGTLIPSAVPIVTQNTDLRPAIARLWRDSRWMVEKDSLSRQGAIKGDAFIDIHPRFDRGRMVMHSVNPERVVDLEKDADGHVLSCCIWDQRRDPEDTRVPFGQRRLVNYHRTMHRRDDGTVDVYTYRDQQAYDWGEGPAGSGAAWTLDIDFVPLVHIEHRDLGYDFGGSELAGVIAKIAESDALGANLSDWIYRALNGPRLLVGLKPGDVTIKADDRQSMAVYYAPTKDARVQTMLDPLPVGETAGVVAMILDEILHDHPELAIDKQRASGDMSGKSLREGRKPAETRVKSRRAAYDLAMVRAHQMAIAMGATYGFEGYEPFAPEGMLDGSLDHQIGDRDVFMLDAFDRLEEQTGRFTMAQAARAAGLTVEDALARAGADPEEAVRARLEQQRLEMLTLLARARPGEGGGTDPALAGLMAQYTTAPDPTQTETRATA
jgi:hypothetical protein